MPAISILSEQGSGTLFRPLSKLRSPPGEWDFLYRIPKTLAGLG
ncbi:hypothetical protein [Laspinema olomoucense]|nr:hypothetical protein [Laspinema sp. D3b]